MGMRMDPTLLMLHGAVHQADCQKEFESSLETLRKLEAEAKAEGDKSEAAFYLALGYFGHEKGLEAQQ